MVVVVILVGGHGFGGQWEPIDLFYDFDDTSKYGSLIGDSSAECDAVDRPPAFAAHLSFSLFFQFTGIGRYIHLVASQLRNYVCIFQSRLCTAKRGFVDGHIWSFPTPHPFELRHRRPRQETSSPWPEQQPLPSLVWL